MENNLKPFYLKLSSTLISITLILLLLYVGKAVLVPLFFAIIFCIFLIKPCDFLENKGVPHSLSAIICMIISILFMAWLFYFISEQLISFKEDLPAIGDNLNKAIDNSQLYIQRHFHISSSKFQSTMLNLREKALSTAPSILGSTVTTLSTIIEYVILVPIYTFLLLLYRNLIVKFVHASFSDHHAQTVSDILTKTKFVVRSYIFGLLTEMLIVAVMLFAGFMIVGAKYAFLMACLIALLNIIPYLGVLTAAILSLIITASSGNSVMVLGVAIVIAIVHLIDSNILLPKIVGSKVKINAFVTILGVIVGSQIWGIPGMFLAVPLMAILKVLFDGIEELRPWGILLGEEELEAKPKKKRIKFLKSDRNVNKNLEN